MEKINKQRVAKPTKNSFDPRRDCFNPEKISKACSRVQQGNKRVDGATMQQLKADNVEKAKKLSLSSLKENNSKTMKVVEDPFTRRPTKPRMVCGVKNVENPSSENNHQYYSEPSQQINTRKALVPLNKEPVGKTINNPVSSARTSQHGANNKSININDSRRRSTIVQQQKSNASRFDPKRECFDPEARSKTINIIDRVKEGNKRVDEAIMKQLKADDEKKAKKLSLSSLKENKPNNSKAMKVVEDPFTRRPTRPRMTSGGSKIIQEKPASEQQQMPPQQTNDKRAPEPLEKEPNQKKMKLNNNH